MIKNKVCLVAETVVRDAETNSISVFNILDGITVEGFPLLIPKMSFLTIWGKDSTDPDLYESTMTLSLNGDILGENKINIDFQGRNVTRQIFAINGVVIKKPGGLECKLSIKDVEDAKYYFTVDAPKTTIESKTDA